MEIRSAASITWSASKQTYYIIRYLVDRQRVGDAYRAYAYFRWVDDQIDQGNLDDSEQIAFIDRQKALIENCYQGEQPDRLATEEHMLADLILAVPVRNSGLECYIRNMMAVIDFDAHRRGRLISRQELSQYSRFLATAVTEALLYFITNDQLAPQDQGRYLAATGAHITHLLRDTYEDTRAGYYNIPREYLAAKGINAQDIESGPYQAWVKKRANLARACFKSGKDYLAKLENVRCRIAGYAYIARFEGVLDLIEKMDYRLAPEYLQGKTLKAGIRMGRSVLSQAFFPSIRK